MTRYNINIKPLLMFFMLNLTLAHFLFNVFDIGGDMLTMLFQYINWMIFALTALMFKRVKSKYIFIMFVIIGNDFLSSYAGLKAFGMIPLAHVYNDFLVSSAIIFSLGVDWSSSLEEDDVCSVMRLMFVIGIIACIYAMIVQNDVLRLVLRYTNAGYVWDYISFFGQRNKFAVVCYLAIICGFFLWLKGGNIIYPVGIALLFVSIVFTDSRNSYFSALLFFGLYFAFKNKISPKTMIILSIPILIIAVAVIGINFDKVSEIFAHKGGHGDIREESRFILWFAALTQLYEHGAWLSGFGVGASPEFLMPYMNFGSFHNCYIDLLFDGGFIRLSVYLLGMILIYRNICRKTNTLYRNCMKAAFLSFAFYCLFESGAMLFCANFFSIFTTTIFAILPHCRKEIG